MRSTVVSAVLIAGVAAQWTGAAPAAAAGAAPVASNPALGATSFAANPSLGASFAANPSLGASLGASSTLGASSAVRSTALGAAPAAQPALGANFGAATQPALGANFGAAAQPAFGANFGAAAQPALGAAPAAGATRAALPASAGATTLAAPTASSGAATRGLPIGTVNGIQDSDVVCAQNGYQGAACGLPNVASIYNPNPAMRYQTQYSDNALSLLQSTNRYNAAGQRIINPATGNAAMDLGTLDIPTQNAIASGVTTTFTNDPTRSAVQSTTTWLNNGALANYVAPSASNAVLPNSVAFQQANAAPWTTTPVNTLTGAGFGYSTLQGVTAGTVKAPVPSTPTVPTATTFGLGATTFGAALPATFSTAGTLPTTFSTGFATSTLPANAWAAQPFTGTTSYLPAATTSYLPAPTTFGTSFQTFPSATFPQATFPQATFPQATFPSATFPATTTQFGLGSTYQLPNYQPAVNPAAQPFTNAYSTPGLVGPPSQAGVVNRPF